MYDAHERTDDREAPEVEQKPERAVLDAALTQEILTADRRGPEAVQGVIALLTAEEREAAIALLQRTRGNHHVSEVLGYGSSERDTFLANDAAFDARAEKDTFLQRALARHRGEQVEPVVAPAATVEVIEQAGQAGLGEQEAVEIAQEVQHETVALAQPDTTVAPESGPGERDVYLANRAAMDSKWERDALFQRALARHRGESVEPPLPGQTVEQAPATPEAAATAEQAVADGPVVQDVITAPPEAAAPPAAVAQAPADLATTFEAAQAAPVSTTKQGIDALNVEGSYDYRMDMVQQIRQDMLTGSQDKISPDVSPEVIEQTVPHLGEGGITNDQMVAIQGYTSQDYEAVNKVMRQPDADPARTAQLAGYVEAVRGGLDALPDYEGEVFRGTGMSQRLWAQWQEKHAAGETVSDPAFSSSSKNEEVAEDFLRKTRDPAKVSVYCRIQSRTGKQIEFLSRTANEAEVLFNSGAQFKIIYIEDTVGPDGLPRKEVFLREVVEDQQRSVG